MDIATVFDPLAVRGDFVVSAGALASDQDLKTAVMISLFTNRRAEDDDQLPEASMSRQGWWADVFQPSRIGSRLWLLAREKQARQVVVRAREYAREALQWLIDDGVASQVLVTTEVVTQGVLGLQVEVIRNQAQPARFKFDLAWQQVRS
ncbi:MAG: phage GP46 family protein [Limnobacter sp.]|uniref:phage GP46 family protein n=1 Tax=Limnobacter sp. TaxID=2003368 RepID=UPI003918DD4F